MPFTFSHPAAVLPFRYLPKGWTSLTGLVIGSMAPDFEKFFNMEGGNSYSHTWGAVFWFCIPLGVILSFLFHLVVRDPLIDNLPAFMRKRLARFKKLDWTVHFRKHYLMIMISIVIGAATHLVWDSFTHKSGAYERQFSFFSGAVDLYGFKLPVFAFLNLLSSVIGMVIVLIAILMLPAEDVAADTKNRSSAYWPVVICIIVGVFVVRLATGLDLEGFFSFGIGLWNSIITVVSAIFISLLIAPFILRLVSLNK